MGACSHLVRHLAFIACVLGGLLLSCSPSAFARADFYITNLPDVGGDSYRVEVLDQPLGDLFRHVYQSDTGNVAVFPKPIIISPSVRSYPVNLFFTGGDFAALLRALKAGFQSTGDNFVCVVFTLDAVVFDRCASSVPAVAPRLQQPAPDPVPPSPLSP